MNILFINSVSDYGSTGKIVRAISDDLKKKGNQVLICYGRKPISMNEDTFYFGDDFQTMFHGVMTRFFGRHGLHSSVPTQKLIHKIKEFSPDVVHLHNLHGYYLNVPMLFEYLAKTDIKVVWTLHDCWTISGNGAYFDYHGCKEWNEGCVVCNETKSYPSSLLFKRQRKNFKWKRNIFTQINKENMTIVTPSDWLKELIGTSFLKKYEIKRIYNGIDVNTFSPINQSDEIDSGVVNILGVANVWDERKGLDEFVELDKKLPDGFRITLIGLNDAQMASIPKSIIAIKRTSDVHELVKYYSNADVYVNLSVEETMGMTTIEAISCGTPVIVYNATAIPEVVTPEVGFVVEKNDFNGLLEIIKTFSYDSFDKKLLHEYAKDFSNEKMVELYTRLLLENRSR